MPVEVSMVATDHRGKAYIPGSSLKGVLRNYLFDVFAAYVNLTANGAEGKTYDKQEDQIKYLKNNAGMLELLWGSPLGEGKLEFGDGSCTTDPPNVPDPLKGNVPPETVPDQLQCKVPPWWNGTRMTYVDHSVAIDPVERTAIENRLYHFEVVPAGAAFRFAIDGQNLAPAELGMLFYALAAFESKILPVTLGAKEGRDFGRFMFKIDQVSRLEQKDLETWKEQAKNNAAAGYNSIKHNLIGKTAAEKGAPTPAGAPQPGIAANPHTEPEKFFKEALDIFTNLLTGNKTAGGQQDDKTGANANGDGRIPARDGLTAGGDGQATPKDPDVGIRSVLTVTWPLQLATPLSIKSGANSVLQTSSGDKGSRGSSAAALAANSVLQTSSRDKGSRGSSTAALAANSVLQTSSRDKTRYENPEYLWNKQKKEERPPQGKTQTDISEATYALKIENNEIVPYGCVPAAAFRGALRSWTIRRLVKEENRKLLDRIEDKVNVNGGVGNSPPVHQTGTPEEKGAAGTTAAAKPQSFARRLKEALDNDRMLEHISKLFGRAVEDGDGMQDSLSRVGRLRVAADHFSGSKGGLFVAGRTGHLPGGPGNVKRHFKERGPVDRITGGARAGGLHGAVEFSPEQSFRVTLSVTNPKAADLELIRLWESRIKDGTLRLGGLWSIGRGRLGLADEQYHLYIRRDAIDDHEMKSIAESAKAEAADDRVWQEYTLKAADVGFKELKSLMGVKEEQAAAAPQGG